MKKETKCFQMTKNLETHYKKFNPATLLLVRPSILFLPSHKKWQGLKAYKLLLP